MMIVTLPADGTLSKPPPSLPAVGLHLDAFLVGAEAGVLVDKSPMAMTVV
jgi:hypothetical protein